MRQAPVEPTAPRRVNTVRLDLSGATNPNMVEINDALLPDVRDVRIETTPAGEVLVTVTFTASVLNAPLAAVSDSQPVSAPLVASTSVDTTSGSCAGCGRDLATLDRLEANYVPLAVSKYGVPLCPDCFKEKKNA